MVALAGRISRAGGGVCTLTIGWTGAAPGAVTAGGALMPATNWSFDAASATVTLPAVNGTWSVAK